MGGIRIKEGSYGLYKPKDKDFYYYWVYDAYKVRHRYSTGCKRKAEALEEIYRRKNIGELIPDNPVALKNLTLTQFGKDFWEYDTCPLVQGKIERGGHYSHKLAKANGAKFRDYIEPELGQYHLKDLTSDIIDKWIISVPKKYKISNKTANDALSVLKQMLDYAVYSSLLEKNLARPVKPLVKEKTRGGAFTVEQIKELFAKPWDNEWAYAACYLASRTGMRVGEVRALITRQIHPTYIEVNASWSNEEGRKTTKSGWARRVPITEEICKMLMNFAPTDPDGLLFSLDGKQPVKDLYFSRRLNARMDEINKEKGYLFFDYKNEDEPLTFHSFRHFLNTRLVAAEIPLTKIQAIIGHESKEMTQHYAHLNDKDLESFRRLQLSLA